MILQAQGITKSFGDLPILKGIDLTVKEGEIVSIVGSSGAGKTTLLQILGTLDKPDAGTYFFDHSEPFKLSAKNLSVFRNTSVGFIFQFHQLLPEFTALENVMLPALIKGQSKEEAKEDAHKLIRRVGLENRVNHKPSEMSGGEQQRIAVCRALINRPKIVFADEPSGNLDSKNSAELHELFFAFRKEFGQTFVIVTHNESLANMADRKLTMRDGLIID
jgi:lipoprotein-releasing system ATP-binding protein